MDSRTGPGPSMDSRTVPKLVEVQNQFQHLNEFEFVRSRNCMCSVAVPITVQRRDQFRSHNLVWKQFHSWFEFGIIGKIGSGLLSVPGSGAILDQFHNRFGFGISYRYKFVQAWIVMHLELRSPKELLCVALLVGKIDKLLRIYGSIVCLFPLYKCSFIINIHPTACTCKCN